MKTHRLDKGITVFAVLCAAFGSTHCASEPPIKCTVTSGAGGTARFKVTAAKMGTCAFDFPFSYDGADVGEGLAIENYPPVNTDSNRDQEVATIAVRSVYVGNRLSAANMIDDNLPSIAQGKFTAVYPDDNDLCHVNTFGLATADLPEVTVDSDGNALPAPVPATHIEYQWSNWRTIVKPSSIGGQSFAHLRYTQDGCTAEYDVAILTPSVECKADVDCKPGNDPYNIKSNIAPEAKAVCEANLSLCVSSKEGP